MNELNLIRLLNRPAWMRDAACAGRTDLFYPGRGAPLTEPRTICDGCSVREQCLEHALTEPEPYGIWGGLSERERKRIRAERLADGTLDRRNREVVIQHGSATSYNRCSQRPEGVCWACRDALSRRSEYMTGRQRRETA